MEVFRATGLVFTGRHVPRLGAAERVSSVVRRSGDSAAPHATDAEVVLAKRGSGLTMRSGTTVCGEHLIAVLIVGLMVVVALVTYPSLKTGADDVAARAKIRASAPLAEAYHLESGVSGATTPEGLPQSYDPALDVSTYPFPVAPDGSASCIERTKDDAISRENEPAAAIESESCP